VKSDGAVRRAIGLSEVPAATLLRAHAVHPVAAVQSEYSLWSCNPEIAVVETCRTIGATFVAAAYAANLELLDGYAQMARSAHLSMAQLALAWVLARGTNVIAIMSEPSSASVTTRRRRGRATRRISNPWLPRNPGAILRPRWWQH
jgi:aryl-alcohol dehydrogenase-like predicted oxidoreductase